MTEYLFEIIWIALMLICIAIIVISNLLHDRKRWEITVDGETFPVVSQLNVDRWHHEVMFWDDMEGRWQHLVYSRLEIYQLYRVEDDQ